MRKTVRLAKAHGVKVGAHEIEAAVLGAQWVINRGDPQLGWDTDQFPNNVPEMALAYYEVLKGGGFTSGGTNFDAKLRRQSIDPEDLLIGHITPENDWAVDVGLAARLELDAAITDVGAGGGRFKAPSLRNIAVRAPYMHDGRAATIPEAILAHGGEAQKARDAFVALNEEAQKDLHVYLLSLTRESRLLVLP